MKKAQFAEKQEKAAFQTTDGKTTVRICMNEQTVDITDQETGEITATEYVYDFNEWTDAEENIDQDAIKADPESYLNYTPAPELTDKEKIEKALANSEYAVILAGGEV